MGTTNTLINISAKAFFIMDYLYRKHLKQGFKLIQPLQVF